MKKLFTLAAMCVLFTFTQAQASGDFIAPLMEQTETSDQQGLTSSTISRFGLVTGRATPGSLRTASVLVTQDGSTIYNGSVTSSATYIYIDESKTFTISLQDSASQSGFYVWNLSPSVYLVSGNIFSSSPITVYVVNAEEPQQGISILY